MNLGSQGGLRSHSPSPNLKQSQDQEARCKPRKRKHQCRQRVQLVHHQTHNLLQSQESHLRLKSLPQARSPPNSKRLLQMTRKDQLVILCRTTPNESRYCLRGPRSRSPKARGFSRSISAWLQVLLTVKLQPPTLKAAPPSPKAATPSRSIPHPRSQLCSDPPCFRHSHCRRPGPRGP